MDEIEKAHPDVFNLLLQVLDDGILSDAKGRTVSFKNTLIILTSNIGSQVIEKGGSSLGFDLATDAANSQYNNIRNLVNEEMKQYFRPELLNRLDEIIVFRQLSREEVNQIADLMLDQVNKRLADRQMQVTLSDAFRDKLALSGYDQRYGARPMRRRDRSPRRRHPGRGHPGRNPRGGRQGAARCRSRRQSCGDTCPTGGPRGR